MSTLYKLNYQPEVSATLDVEKRLSESPGVVVMWVLVSRRSVRSGSFPSETYRTLVIQLAAR